MTKTPIDKTSWGPGLWQDEPDRKEWRDPTTGYPCLANRVEHSGSWCGYVAVPPGHPAHGKQYDNMDIDVHGGLTFASMCSGEICHVPAEGEPDDVYWFGFDCAHYSDLSPASRARYPEFMSGDSYRPLSYVEAECTSLAAQLKAMEP